MIYSTSFDLAFRKNKLETKANAVEHFSFRLKVPFLEFKSMPVRVRKHNKSSLEEGAKTLDMASSGVSPAVSKACFTIESRIEGIWHDSAKTSWSFAGFAAVMLEVLAVLQEQDRRRAKAKRRFKGA